MIFQKYIGFLQPMFINRNFSPKELSMRVTHFLLVAAMFTCAPAYAEEAFDNDTLLAKASELLSESGYEAHSLDIDDSGTLKAVRLKRNLDDDTILTIKNAEWKNFRIEDGKALTDGVSASGLRLESEDDEGTLSIKNFEMPYAEEFPGAFAEKTDNLNNKEYPEPIIATGIRYTDDDQNLVDAARVTLVTKDGLNKLGIEDMRCIISEEDVDFTLGKLSIGIENAPMQAFSEVSSSPSAELTSSIGTFEVVLNGFVYNGSIPDLPPFKILADSLMIRQKALTDENQTWNPEFRLTGLSVPAAAYDAFEELGGPVIAQLRQHLPEGIKLDLGASLGICPKDRPGKLDLDARIHNVADLDAHAVILTDVDKLPSEYTEFAPLFTEHLLFKNAEATLIDHGLVKMGASIAGVLMESSPQELLQMAGGMVTSMLPESISQAVSTMLSRPGKLSFHAEAEPPVLFVRIPDSLSDGTLKYGADTEQGDELSF